MTNDIPLKLAIVDDDDDVRTALSRLLRAMGHQVKLFMSAEDFERENAAVDCVIVDVRLPGVSGLELCDRLRSRAVPTPVVLITGDGGRLAPDLSEAAHTRLVTKPFDDKVLSLAILDAMSSVASQKGRHAL